MPELTVRETFNFAARCQGAGNKAGGDHAKSAEPGSVMAENRGLVLIGKHSVWFSTSVCKLGESSKFGRCGRPQIFPNLLQTYYLVIRSYMVSSGDVRLSFAD